MKHLSLFSGIGGFDLAAQWVGWENVAQVEKDEWCRKVLAKNFPSSKQFADIKDFDGKEYTNQIDIISGGFPCQPFSVAGQRKGKEDDRYLWEEMLRVITTIKPPFVVGENVTGIIGMALDTVLSDLEAQNYITETFIIPACGKNAWHRRDRVWIVAYTISERTGNYSSEISDERRSSSEIGRKSIRQTHGKTLPNRIDSTSAIFSNSTTSGFQNGRIETMDRPEQKQELKRCSGVPSDTNNAGREEQRERITDGEKFFAPQCSSWWETEPGMGRVVNGLSGRVDRLKGLGNAIVPQIAYEIFKAIDLQKNGVYV